MTDNGASNGNKRARSAIMARSVIMEARADNAMWAAAQAAAASQFPPGADAHINVYRRGEGDETHVVIEAWHDGNLVDSFTLKGSIDCAWRLLCTRR